MRGFDIGRMARNGEYCDICKKMVYENIWGHVAMHRRRFQEAEDARASREAPKDFMERLGQITGRKSARG